MVLLASNGKAMEIVKVPALIEHYSQHKQQQSQLTFNEFLFMHYVGDDANSQDNNSDEQLPFKGSTENSVNLIDGIWIPSNGIQMESLIDLESETKISDYSENQLQNYNSPLFRPPVLN